MKRRLRVGIRSREHSYTAALQALQRVEGGDRTAHASGLYFESLEDLRKILTAKRLDLLVAILRQTPQSVTELARLVKRDLKNVGEDLTLLRQLGLVEFVAAEGHGNARAPVVPYDEIDITIDLQALAETPHEIERVKLHRKSLAVKRPKVQKAQKADEAQVFEAFLQAFPSLKASITSWEQPEKEPPDISCHIGQEKTRNFELTRWLHQKQIEKSRPRVALEQKILSAIGEQGENPTRNIHFVMLELKEKVRGLGRQDSKGMEEMRKLKEEMYHLISETDRLWPKHREWHTPRGYYCKELDQYPTLRKYLSYVYFDPIRVGTEVRKKPLGGWIMCHPQSGFYSPNDAWEALRQTIRNKLKEYKDRKDIPPNLDLIIYYGGETLLYNTPFQDIDVWTFADAAKIAAGIISTELQGLQHPFERVYLLEALHPQPKAFCVYPKYQECHY